MVQPAKIYPNTEVTAKTGRRRIGIADKRRILNEAERCQHGELGALLRREGIYYSQLASWRKAHQAGTLVEKKRGPQAQPEQAELKRLQAENERLKQQLGQAEAIIEAQKKLARLLENLKEGQS